MGCPLKPAQIIHGYKQLVATGDLLECARYHLHIVLVNLDDIPIKRFSVESEQDGKEWVLRAIRYGQKKAMTYIGQLPAGRYHPKELLGEIFNETMTVPLQARTGKVDVEAGRVTQLGTAVFAAERGKHDPRLVGSNVWPRLQQVVRVSTFRAHREVRPKSGSDIVRAWALHPHRPGNSDIPVPYRAIRFGA